MVIGWIVTIILLSAVCTYMYIRLIRLAKRKEEGSYVPNIVVSAIEILMFIVVFSVSVNLVGDKPTEMEVISFSIIAFAITLLTFNSAVIKLIKFLTLPVNIAILIGYYTLVSNVLGA